MKNKNRFRSFLSIASSAVLAVNSVHATTFVWANSNVAGATPPTALNWINATQGTWTGGTPVSDSATVIQFFQDNTTALGNTVPLTQTSTIDNGGSAFQLGTLTLSGKASNSTGANLTMNISGDALNFSAATGTINFDAVNNTRGITYNLNSNIQLGTASSAGALTITGAGTGTFNIGGAISELQTGGGSLIKSGSSTLTLTGVNSYTDGLAVSAGSLILSNSGNTFSGGISISGGSTLTANSTGAMGLSDTITFSGTGGKILTAHSGYPSFTQGIQIDSSATGQLDATNQFYHMTFNGPLTGSGVLAVTSSNNGAGNVTLASTANTFTGAITIGGGGQAGNLFINSLADSANAITLGNGAGAGNIAFGAGTIAPVVLTNRQFVLAGTTGGGTIRNNASSSANTVTINSNLSITTNGAKTLTLGGTNSGDNKFAGTIGDSGSGATSIAKIENGRWILGNAANTYTGITTVSAGTLDVTKLADGGSNSSIGKSGAGAANLVFNGGALRYVGTGDSTNRNLALPGSATIDSSGTGALNLSQTGVLSPDYTENASAAWSTVSQKKITGLADVSTLAVGMRVTGTGIAANTTIVSIDSASQVTVSTNFTASGGGSVNFGYPTARTLTLTGSNTDANTIAGSLQNSTVTGSGALSLTKTGLGKWGLTGTNSYTGTTFVNYGTLELKSGASNLSQTLGNLNYNQGEGTLISNRSGSGTLSTTFATFGRTNSGTINIKMIDNGNPTDTDTNNRIFSSAAAGAGFISIGTFFNGANYAAFSGAAGYVQALVYDGTNTTTNGTTGTITASTHVKRTVDTSPGNTSLLSLNLSGGGVDWTQTGSLTVPGIIKSGGGTASLISGGTLARASGAELVVRTDTVDDILEISSLINATGTQAVTKSGAGTLILSNTANAYTGQTHVNAGTLSISHNRNLGAVTSGQVNLKGGATLQATNTFTLDNAGANKRTISVAYANNIDVTASNEFTISGTIINGNVAGGFTKTGTGKLILGGENTYTGDTTVTDGTLVVNGNISTSVLTTVETGATLGGSGTVGNLTIDSGGFFSPGNSPGTTTVNGAYTQNGSLVMEVTGLTAGTEHDQVIVNGTVTLNGLLDLTTFSGSYAANNLIFILLNNDVDAVTGTFTGLAQGAVAATYGGFDWQISYLADSGGSTFTGGNDVALLAVAAIPEPNVAALLGGLGTLLLLRRRR